MLLNKLTVNDDFSGIKIQEGKISFSRRNVSKGVF